MFDSNQLMNHDNSRKEKCLPFRVIGPRPHLILNWSIKRIVNSRSLHQPFPIIQLRPHTPKTINKY